MLTSDNGFMIGLKPFKGLNLKLFLDFFVLHFFKVKWILKLGFKGPPFTWLYSEGLVVGLFSVL